MIRAHAINSKVMREVAEADAVADCRSRDRSATCEVVASGGGA